MRNFADRENGRMSMPGAMKRARSVAADFLRRSGQTLDAEVIAAGGGDDFAEVKLALQTITTATVDTGRLERALRCYADRTFWNIDCPEASLAFHDQGEIARAALDGKELYAQHRD